MTKNEAEHWKTELARVGAGTYWVEETVPKNRHGFTLKSSDNVIFYPEQARAEVERASKVDA